MATRSYRAHIKSNYGTPTDEQLERINSRLETPLTKDMVFVWRAIASNYELDSYFSRMGESSLKNYATDYAEGRSFMNSHEARERATGRTFDGTYNGSDRTVEVWSYTLRDYNVNGGNTNDFIRGIEGGLINDVSIRFSGGQDTCLVPGCGHRLYSKGCRHIPGMEYEIEDSRAEGGRRNIVAEFRIDDAHATELSDVYKGSTPGAGILRKIGRMFKRNELDTNMVRQVESKYQMNLRTYIEGEEFLKFGWEDNSDTDESVTADGHMATDGDGPNDPSSVNGLPKDVKNPPDHYVSDDGQIDGRKDKTMAKMTKDERETNIRLFTEQIEKEGSTLDPEYLREVNEFLKAIRDDGASEYPLPPTKKKTPSPEDADDDKEKPRYLKPVNKEFNLDGFMRAVASQNLMTHLGTPGGMDPGQMDLASASMLAPGMDPLASVASKEFSESNGPDIPGDGELLKGVNSISSPLITLNPGGAASFFFNGTGSTMGGEAAIDGVIPMRAADGSAVRFEPIVIRLDDVNNVRVLWDMAREGMEYRARLMYDMVRFGCITQGKDFDKDLHIELARVMPMDRLKKYVDTWRSQANNKLRTSDVEDKTVSDFDGGSVKNRQTINQGAHSREHMTEVRFNPDDNIALYK